MVDIVHMFWPSRKGMYTCMYFFFEFSESSHISIYFLAWKPGTRKYGHANPVDCQFPKLLLVRVNDCPPRVRVR